MSPRLLLCCAAALCMAACGGDAKPAARTGTAPTPGAGASPAPRSAGDLSRERPIIDAWAKALARSDVERATGYFALPVVVEQGRALRLRTRDQVRTFNDGLPCGARLLSVKRERGYVVGTFELTDRPGSRCDAPGETAKVALRFKDGRFSEWRQVPEPAAAPAAPSEAA